MSSDADGSGDDGMSEVHWVEKAAGVGSRCDVNTHRSSKGLLPAREDKPNVARSPGF